MAEVADGQRLGLRVFVVVRRAFPHHVAGISSTFAGASALRRRFVTVRDLVIVGPVSPTIDLGPRGGFMTGGCVHNRWTTAMRDKPTAAPLPAMDSVVALDAQALISDSISLMSPPLGYCGTETVPPSNVVSVTITTKLRDSTLTTVVYPGGTLDAVFFTLDAMDKFVFPYYTKLFGVAAAASMRAEMVQGIHER
ncbi:MAG TPA: hypothetical protein VGJ83_05520 [Gemmatimonadales bacterium]